MRSLATLSLLSTLTLGAPSDVTRSAPHAPATRHELVAVYIGSIGIDSVSGMREIVPAMKVSLAGVATANGRAFVSKGVSIEPLVADGFRDLQWLGGFDEMSVGGNWTNTSVVQYLMRSPAGTRAIPQVIVLERDVTTSDRDITVTPEREVARLVGVAGIANWVKRGTPLP